MATYKVAYFVGSLASTSITVCLSRRWCGSRRPNWC